MRLSLLTLCLLPALASAQTKTVGQIHRADPRFDALVATDAKIEQLADGFDWAEGPVWVKSGNYLLFSDIPKNMIWKWDGQALSSYMKPAGYSGDGKYPGREPGSNGLLIDKEGRLILCQHGDRRIARREADGKLVTLADKFEGKRFNSPNDAVFKSNGDLYFTDPPYGLPKAFNDPARELPYCGVYRWSAKDGTVTLLTKEMSAPNGIAFSPDEKTLYVANSDGKKAVWMAYPVNGDGTIGVGKIFYDATPLVKQGLQGAPDGLKVDAMGNVFATGPGGVHVFAPDGTPLGRIDPGCKVANCGWGDDGSVLYLTADKTLCRIRTKTIGLGMK